MKDVDLYREYVRNRKSTYGARRMRKEKRVRKQHFFSKKQRIEELVKQAKADGLTRRQSERQVRMSMETADGHVYGGFVLLIIQALISWLIKRMIDNYFNE